MTLPLLLSVPHGGLRIPPEVEDVCLLTPREVAEDGDEGAREIYDLAGHVVGFVSAEVARAVVDVNRAADDFRKDGVVKTHTCWDVPVYRDPLPTETVKRLIERYHHPYHRQLKELAAGKGAALGVDCHTMAAQGPPVGPDAGQGRPRICISDADGTLPREWFERFADCLAATFGEMPSLNTPFRGGFITRSHATEIPWVQLELSREDYLPLGGKRKRILEALRHFCAGL